jgi:hypothetical protein
LYATPLDKPVITIGDAVLEDEIPVFDVAVKLRVVGYPLELGPVKVKDTWALPAVAVPIVGASGTTGQILSPLA